MSTLRASTPPEPRVPDPHDGIPLAIVVVEVDSQVFAFVSGEIDLQTCGRLRDAIEPHLGPDQQVVVDLSGVTFMDSSCLRVLERARTTLSADGGSLILRNPSSAAHRLLSVAGMTELFKLEAG